jgi:bacteriocin-like protein
MNEMRNGNMKELAAHELKTIEGGLDPAPGGTCPTPWNASQILQRPGFPPRPVFGKFVSE